MPRGEEARAPPDQVLPLGTAVPVRAARAGSIVERRQLRRQDPRHREDVAPRAPAELLERVRKEPEPSRELHQHPNLRVPVPRRQ